MIACLTGRVGPEIIVLGVWWDLRFNIFRDLVDMMAERGLSIARGLEDQQGKLTTRSSWALEAFQPEPIDPTFPASAAVHLSTPIRNYDDVLRHRVIPVNRAAS